jgi:hypothetical protein
MQQPKKLVDVASFIGGESCTNFPNQNSSFHDPAPQNVMTTE